MEKIDRYINKIYMDMNDNSKDIKDLKEEMREHLKETAKELQQNGVSEDESIRIAIERFGETLSIRKELNKVLNLHKLYAKKILLASIIFFMMGVIIFITSHFVQKNQIKRYKIMNSEIHLIEDKVKSEGIKGADKWIKGIFEDKRNNQLNYVKIKELPSNFDESKNIAPFKLKSKYSYPKKIKSEYYGNACGSYITFDNTKYFLEIGMKTEANGDNSSVYMGVGLLAFIMCWILLIIWSIKNIHMMGELNTGWCILLVLTSIIGYFIFLTVKHYNKKRTLMYE